MLKLSKLTDYAVVALVRLGQKSEVTTSPVLSRSTGIPEPTVAKVLKILATQGIVSSQRGARGGYRLARPLEEISIAAVIQAIDGPISLTTCVDGGDCDARSTCGLGGQWDMVNAAIRHALSAITLADMKNHTVTDRLGGLHVPPMPDGPEATA
ncbi:SUF system Fe-S cluster assembly regulator [Komagataeibacter nataicola]|uniref:SUF system Fe-S cluster assembly regulator n=1 Tax=Komagataeibacter nataicola TaxID=265960 RepID=A0A9N7H0H1_9PROT|nr:SUF system Fe-S cluster assembly regulator [Komagataeibacter nataicola]AQU86792.1 SUF system Fe-S cluster assembly regulator [Komagataeibacter nataicola]PYD67811.1 SUF system Fe-S cluster assembly regulator [Komagataeibacter nataicola]WEQ56259.1 SUF system Fe-S cluster assembly regulator [Komagataeibacter nataicola]WNM07836.1 SUF system Fe-S cluster assembly regulator [Komagataeibacter nataicola]